MDRFKKFSRTFRGKKIIKKKIKQNKNQNPSKQIKQHPIKKQNPS